MNKTPKVSIVSISYNQENYIRQALDSFIAQQTDFKMEIVIADDCSTDSTQSIIREYVKAYPKLFKAILRKKNVGVAENLYGALRAANGQYIALCEGDDYWTDPQKLQRQADFMDRNPDFALCFHPVRVFFDGGESEDYIYPDQRKDQEFFIEELLKDNYIQTNSVMYRKQTYQNMPNGILPVDWYLHLYHAQYGKIGFIPNVMAAYRRHPGGVWWETANNVEEFWKKHGIKHLGLFAAILNLFAADKSYRPVIDKQIFAMFDRFSEIDNQDDTILLKQAIKQFPDLTQAYITDLKKAITSRDSSLHKVEHVANELRQVLHHRNEELKTIKQSRLWKIRNKVLRITGKSPI